MDFPHFQRLHQMPQPSPPLGKHGLLSCWIQEFRCWTKNKICSVFNWFSFFKTEKWWYPLAAGIRKTDLPQNQTHRLNLTIYIYIHAYAKKEPCSVYSSLRVVPHWFEQNQHVVWCCIVCIKNISTTRGSPNGPLNAKMASTFVGKTVSEAIFIVVKPPVTPPFWQVVPSIWTHCLGGYQK